MDINNISPKDLLFELETLRTKVAKLEQSEEKYRTLFEQSRDASMIIEDMVVIDCNQASCDLFGISKTEIIGKPIGYFSPTFQPNGLLSSELGFQHLMKANAEGNNLFDWIHIKSDGTEFFTEVMLTSIILNNKKLFLSTMRDITQSIQMTDQLRASEAQLRLIFNTIEDLYFQSDQGGILQIVSPNIERIIGWTADEVIGQSLSNYYANPNEREYLQSILYNAGYVSDYELLLNLKNGSKGYFSLSARVFYDSDSKFKGVSGLLRDISMRKEIENILDDNREKYQLLSENILDVIWVYNITEDKMKYVSPSVINLTGFTPEEALLQNLETALSPESIKMTRREIPIRLAKHLNGDKSDDSKVYEWQQYRKDGALVWIEVTVTLTDNFTDGGICIIGVSRNIEKRKIIEKQVQEKNAELEIINSTKDKFFSIVAHDLKNPLGGFREMSSMLYDNYETFDETDRKDFLLMLKNSSNSLFQFLENLLEWARSQRGQIQFAPEECNLFFIVHNCLELLQLNADKKNITINNKIPMFSIVVADSNLITTVFRNLISNAIKFTPQGGVITIGIKENNESDEVVIVFVKDTGVGMNQETLDKLFRIDCSKNGIGTAGETGTGLGLILCKEFVEKHNGKIGAESEVGKGSTLYFTLPTKNIPKNK